MKTISKTVTFTFIIFCLLFVPLKAQTTFYVAVNGNDYNPGTIEKPLATLTGARNAVRNLKSKKPLTEPVDIIIEPGIWYMDKPLILKPDDSGTEEAPITYKAAPQAKPKFYGGIKITGFKIGKNGIWSMKVPEKILQNKGFNRIYINGNAAHMARTPDSGFLKIDHVTQKIIEKGEGRIALKAQQTLFFDSVNFIPLKQIKQNELKNVRFITYHKWDFTIRPVDKINNDSLCIVTTGKGMKPWNPIQNGGRIIFENYAAALTAPGEWFLNDNGILFYKPRKGETPENSEVIIPVLQELISIRGNHPSGQKVQNIRFEGLSFSCAQHPVSPNGMEPQQASLTVNAAITVKGAVNIVFNNCRITHIDQHALRFGKGCSRCVVSHCYINDTGGGGIYIGDAKPAENQKTHHITVDNNIIQNGGNIFPAAVGIWIGQSSDNIISHNDIGDFYYTGVSVGWTWGYAPSLAKRNKIVFNHIHHIGWALLSDMAAVYTLGKSEGTVISNNVIDHIHAYSYGGWGLYTDEGSSDITMENNLVFSTKTGGFHQHYGKNNTIRNNIFAFAGICQVQCTRVEKHLSFVFENNIVVFDTGMVLKGPWSKINIGMDYNIYWNTKKSHYDFAGMSFSKWQQTGHDRNSLITDPCFADADNFNFKITDKSNSDKINFVPFDYSKAGVYGEKEWIKKARLPKVTITAFNKAVRENMKRQ
jgi:parallel beta-helix repeat protein